MNQIGLCKTLKTLALAGALCAGAAMSYAQPANRRAIKIDPNEQALRLKALGGHTTSAHAPRGMRFGTDPGLRGCVTCPSGGTPENEPDCGLPTDTVNGGCNSTPPVFSPISFGQTYCGTGAFDTTIGFRDTDWYEFTIGARTNVVWTATAEFDVLIGFVASPCPQTQFIPGTAVTGGPCTQIMTQACLNPGTYYAFIAPQFLSAVTCGAQYVATLTSGDCPPPAGNDLCTDATTVGAGTHPFDNTQATTDGPSNCGLMANDVWFRFTSSGSGSANITTCGLTGLDTVLNVYNAPCIGSSVICLDDSCGFQTSINFNVTAGNTYLLQLGGFNGARGTGQFTLTLPEITGACCIGDTCSVMTPANCAAGGGVYQGDGTDCGVSGYEASTCGNAFEDISASGTPGCAGDDCATTVPIGFNFTFYGTTFTNITVGSNGYMTFPPNSGTVFTNAPIPTAAAPNNLICPLWDDWRTDTGGTLDYQTLGSAPNRRFIAQWTNVRHFANAAQMATFQAVLFEGSNNIEYRYNNWALNSPTIGIENSTGTVGTSIDPGTVGQVSCQMLEFQLADNPCDCRADWNGDGFLTGEDFDEFTEDFEAGDADYNGDGFTTGEDFDQYVEDFEAGC